MMIIKGQNYQLKMKMSQKYIIYRPKLEGGLSPLFKLGFSQF